MKIYCNYCQDQKKQMKITEAQINSLKNGDQKVFQLVFDRYADRIHHFACKFLNDPMDAKEVVQEVFISLWLHRNRLGSSETFEAYLFKIAKNYLLNYIKKKGVQKYHYSMFELYNPLPEQPDQYAIYEELKSLTEKAIQHLPAQRKKIYQLSRIEGLSNREISEKLQLSLSTVENHLNLSLKYLKQILKEKGDIILLIFLWQHIQ
jgi:RNA polymerase sigma-70 factor (ECF subfamily)